MAGCLVPSRFCNCWARLHCCTAWLTGPWLWLTGLARWWHGLGFGLGLCLKPWLPFLFQKSQKSAKNVPNFTPSWCKMSIMEIKWNYPQNSPSKIHLQPWEWHKNTAKVLSKCKVHTHNWNTSEFPQKSTIISNRKCLSDTPKQWKFLKVHENCKVQWKLKSTHQLPDTLIGYEDLWMLDLNRWMLILLSCRWITRS